MDGEMFQLLAKMNDISKGVIEDVCNIIEKRGIRFEVSDKDRVELLNKLRMAIKFLKEMEKSALNEGEEIYNSFMLGRSLGKAEVTLALLSKLLGVGSEKV